MRPRGWPSTLACMALSSLSEAIVLSSSCFSSSWPSDASFPHLGHSKTQWGPLPRKHEYFFSASSFLPFHLSLGGLSFLGVLSWSPPPLSRPPAFLAYHFCESRMNSISDSAAAIAEVRSCTSRLSSSILAHPHRSSRKQNRASCSPMLGIFKRSSGNSFTYSRRRASLC